MYHPALGTFLTRDPLPLESQSVLLGGSLYAYVENNPINAVDPSGAVTIWNYAIPTTYTYGDYHGQFRCDANDTCDSAIAKLQAWITNGSIRTSHLHGILITGLKNGTVSPQGYRNHMEQLYNTNRHIINCWVIVKDKCTDDCPDNPNERQIPGKPYMWKVPSRIPDIPRQPAPWWVPGHPSGDTYQDIFIGVGVVGVVIGGWVIGGAVASGGATGGAVGGGATILVFPTASGTSELIAAGLLVSFSLDE